MLEIAGIIVGGSSILTPVIANRKRNKPCLNEVWTMGTSAVKTRWKAYTRKAFITGNSGNFRMHLICDLFKVQYNIESTKHEQYMFFYHSRFRCSLRSKKRSGKRNYEKKINMSQYLPKVYDVPDIVLCARHLLSQSLLLRTLHVGSLSCPPARREDSGTRCS